MGKRLYPLNHIKYWWAYDIEEVCEKLKVGHKAVQNWIKNGLATIGTGRPYLIYGYDLKKFLQNMNERNKCKTEFHHIFCVGCKDGKSPLKKQVKLEYVNGSIKVKAICSSCKSIMYQNYKLKYLQELKRVFNVVEVLELYDCETPTVKTPLEDTCDKQTKEPMQGELL